MKIYGTFTSNDRIDYKLELYDDTPDSGEQIEIGDNGIYFADDPINITREIEDSFSVILPHTCEITLHTNRYLGDLLFSATLDRYVRVTEETSGKVIFQGYIQPMTFEQPYVYHLDEFTVHCIDYLGGLEYSKWKGADKGTYEYLKSNSDTISMRGVIEQVLCTPEYGVNLPYTHLLYDASVGITSADTSTVLSEVFVDENVFYGDNYDSVMYNNEILDTVLKYLNLHITQIGEDLYLFNWNTIRNHRNTWYRFSDNDTYSAVTLTAPTISKFTGEQHADSDNTITIDDVYAQIQVKDNITDMDDVISSPLDSSSISNYYGKQLLMTEYMSSGFGFGSFRAFRDMIMDDGSQTYNGNTNENAMMVDHYYQHIYSKNWKFYVKQGDNIIDIDSLVSITPLGEYINQWRIPDAIYNPYTSPNVGMMQFGHVDRKLRVTDNSPEPQIEMTPYIVISINGNESDDPSQTEPSQDAISAHTSFVEYTSPQKNVTYSPTDDTYENYLVFSGKMELQRRIHDRFLEELSYGYNSLREHVDDKLRGIPTLIKYTTPFSFKDDSAIMYYTRRWYRSTYPNGTPITQPDSYRGLQPPTTYENKNLKLYNYQYSSAGDSNDKCYKLPLIECELIIGDKRLVETSWGKWDENRTPTFQWVTIGQEPWVSYTNDQGLVVPYQVKTFTLGIDPSIDNWIIGEEYDIQNTVDWKTMNLGDSTKGTAIKITNSDNLVGELTFRIKGIVFATWKEVTTGYHGWFLWRHSVWDEDERAVFAHCENLFIKDFKCQLMTNKPETSSSDSTSSDIIYVSAEENYPTIKDDIDFGIVTQPSMETCLTIGADYTTALNAAYYRGVNGNKILTTMYDATIGEHDIPEKLYVNSYYNEYHTPKVLLKGTYHMREDNVWRNIYKSEPLGNKQFYIKEIQQSLKWNTAEITFKQI